MKRVKARWQHIIIVVVFWGALISPVMFYSSVFGFGLWDNNEDWARMGSAVGGLYAPILSLFTFMLLGLQLYRQNQVDNHNYVIWFIDRSLSGGEKSLKLMNELRHEESINNLTVWNGLLLIINNGKREDIQNYLGLPVNQRFYSAATTYFSNLEGLKNSKNPHMLLACEELKAEAAIRLGYHDMVIIERNVMSGMLSYGPYFELDY
ncbi:hypothetical protein [Vibrio parahaemolyticus]|uniref:hypothetical protein n=1 Tax=Vibrio parahaemolyticus TaxID=670 RepID=UPI003892334E